MEQRRLMNTAKKRMGRRRFKSTAKKRNVKLKRGMGRRRTSKGRKLAEGK